MNMTQSQNISEDIRKAYIRMLTPLKNRLGNMEGGLTSAPPMVGKKFTESICQGRAFRLLVVGRAVNGWEIPFQNGSAESLTQQIFESAIDMNDIGAGKVYDETSKQKKEIYNYHRSPFFQLCHALLTLYGFGGDWSEHIAWTNLYKIVPYKFGNPNNKLIRETLKFCAEILQKEILWLQPTHIVFVTGDWWYKPIGRGMDQYAFINETGVDLYEKPEFPILGSGISNVFPFHPNIVITVRPERAGISREAHAKSIFRAFEANI